jgi:hypothetical protein
MRNLLGLGKRLAAGGPNHTRRRSPKRFAPKNRGSNFHKIPKPRDDEAALTTDIIALAI